MNRRNIGMIACSLALVAMVQFTSAGYRVEDEAQQIAEEALWLLDQRDFGRLYEEFMSEEFRQTVAVEDFGRRFDEILGRIGQPRPDSRRLQQVDSTNALPDSSAQDTCTSWARTVGTLEPLLSCQSRCDAVTSPRPPARMARASLLRPPAQ